MCQSLAHAAEIEVRGWKIIYDYSEIMKHSGEINKYVLLQEQSYKRPIQMKYLAVRLQLINKTRECNHTISQFPILATGKSRGA